MSLCIKAVSDSLQTDVTSLKPGIMDGWVHHHYDVGTTAPSNPLGLRYVDYCANAPYAYIHFFTFEIIRLTVLNLLIYT